MLKIHQILKACFESLGKAYNFAIYYGRKGP
jgi:hypothetical protein